MMPMMGKMAGKLGICACDTGLSEWIFLIVVANHL